MGNSGLVAELPTYESSEDTIEKIVSIKSSRWIFPGHDQEDIAQEVRLICWQAIQKYDPAKEGKGIFYFLARCVDNALYNKGRGVYFDNNPPCLRCPHYDKVAKECCGSQRYLDYQDRMARRRAIDNPMALSSLTDSDDDDTDCLHLETHVGSITGLIDLDVDMRSFLPTELLPFYDMMASGEIADVPISIRRRIRECIRDAT